jgi:hypothetical protein
MAIPVGYKDNFQTILKAAKNDDLCLLECTDAATGKPVMVICAVMRNSDDSLQLAPFAKMFDGNPYEEVIPPSEPKAA